MEEPDFFVLLELFDPCPPLLFEDLELADVPDAPECVLTKRAFFSASVSSARSDGASAPPRNTPRESINRTLEDAATGNGNTA